MFRLGSVSRPRSRRAPWRLAVLAALGLALTASAVGAAAGASAAFPVTVSAGNGPVRIAQRPVRIVSLSPTATEMLFAIGAGHQVVAVDEDSDYPKSAPRTSLSGLSPNVEALARYRPDLVVLDYDPSGFATRLRALGIPVLVQQAPDGLAGTYHQITELGLATGHGAAARALVASMRAKIAADYASRPHFSSPISYYYELDQTYYTVTSSTFVGRLLAPLGLRNIADKAPGAAGGYPQLSAEYIIHADPRLILLADTICCHQDERTVAKRPGWSAITAVRDHDVVGLDDDIASRWGPRVVDLLSDVEQALWKLNGAEKAA